jgi:glutamate 5-kinase
MTSGGQDASARTGSRQDAGARTGDRRDVSAWTGGHPDVGVRTGSRRDAGALTGGRPDIAGARRVVVKVGSSSLTTPAGGIDEQRITALTDALAARAGDGTQLVLVSSGAIAAGLAPLGLSRRPRDLATQQAAASVGQGILVARYTAAFGRHGVQTGQVLLTADDLMRRGHYRNAQRTLDRLLGLGVLPVVNENDTVATEEIRFGDNDRLAALVAHVVKAGALVLLSDVDGLYDGDPRLDGARRITEVRTAGDLAAVELSRPRGVAVSRGTAGDPGRVVGTGGMVTKVESALLAASAGIPAVVAAADQAVAALAGEHVGTYFVPGHRRPGARQLWLAHAAVGRGRLRLDGGAVRAVVERRASLLPAGVVGVEGDFEAGDPVDLCDEGGGLVARGLVNYDAAEIPGLMGRTTRSLAAELGPAYEREIVHRDDLVLLTQSAPVNRSPAG